MKGGDSIVVYKAYSRSTPFNHFTTYRDEKRFDALPFQRRRGGFSKDRLQGFSVFGVHEIMLSNIAIIDKVYAFGPNRTSNFSKNATLSSISLKVWVKRNLSAPSNL